MTMARARKTSLENIFFCFVKKQENKNSIWTLRWLNTVSSTYIWMGRYNHSLLLDAMVFLRGHTVAMVTYNVKKMMTTCSPMIEQFFDTMIVASSDKEWL